MQINYQPIGIIHTPYKELSGIPNQPISGKDIAGTVEVFPELRQGLEGVTQYTHLVLLFHLHMTKDCALRVRPFHGDKPRGLFATRSPRRPNPIGLSVVRLLKVDGCTLHISDLDILDGTPLLDIKPYIPAIDGVPSSLR